MLDLYCILQLFNVSGSIFLNHPSFIDSLISNSSLSSMGVVALLTLLARKK